MAIALIKFSILIFYRRLFPGRGFLIALLSVGGFVLAWWITNVTITFLQCRPFAYHWDKTIPEGKCLNTFATLVSLAILNMITDVAILSLPVTRVWKLQMPIHQRLAVIGIFMLGGL
jgi:hypothetical protein